MKLELLPPDSKYAEVLHQWRNEAHTLKHNPVKERTVEELRLVLGQGPFVLSPLEESKCYRWFVGYENQVIGTVSLSNVNLMMGLGEIGYMIAQDFQGRGIATKAIRLWTTMLLEKTNLRKLTASVAEQNHASIRVLEKNGYKSEGLLVDHFLINGKPVSQHVFGLLRNQMHHLQEAPSKTKR